MSQRILLQKVFHWRIDPRQVNHRKEMIFGRFYVVLVLNFLFSFHLLLDLVWRYFIFAESEVLDYRGKTLKNWGRERERVVNKMRPLVVKNCKSLERYVTNNSQKL